jgi:hypothetical protein
MKRRLPDVLYNPLSIAGAALAATSFLTVVFLTFVELFQKAAPAYIGIISYVLLPIPLIVGLILVPLGAWREKRRLARGMPASRLQFTVDLNSSRQRSALILFATFSIILLLFTAYGSYRTFEWTESVEFCGTTCHSVMEPEHTAYQNSPHARVKCVDCHVGSGAGWYVRSKLSGAYQVYAVLANVYPRPIPTPIKNLRPARETCEQCHWPSHFSGHKEVINTYFKSDEQNTRWTIGLLMKIGGSSSGEQGPHAGIHWHADPEVEITFVSPDTLRQTIPWLRVKDSRTGVTTEYRSTENTVSDEDLRVLPTSRMDCIDCHNRPSHIYRPPSRIVDNSLAGGRISTKLPGVRAVAIGALTAGYTSTVAAMDSIPLALAAHYQGPDSALSPENRELVSRASAELQDQYRRNIFPRMNVSWKAYPNNIGHMTDLGCFRCHDDKHVSAEGKVISKDCNSCHTIMYQGTGPRPEVLSATGLEFRHPEDIGDAWRETHCRDCHTGG